MNELTKILLNIRSLRSFARDNLTIEQCEEALDKLSQVVAERQQIAQEEQAANAEREAKLKEYADMLEKDGLNVEELIAALSNESTKKTRKQRESRPAKYKYILNGEEKTWTGQGRTPLAIQEQLDQGASLEDFLI